MLGKHRFFSMIFHLQDHVFFFLSWEFFDGSQSPFGLQQFERRYLIMFDFLNIISLCEEIFKLFVIL